MRPRPDTMRRAGGRAAVALLATAAPWAVAAAAVPPLEVSLRLHGQGSGHLTGPGSDLQCEGGDWQFDWAGRVPGESASVAALLAGDAMFFTTDERGGWRRPPVLGGNGMRCTRPAADGGPRLPALRGTLQRAADAAVDVQVSLAADQPYVGVRVEAAGVCRAEYAGAPPVDLPVALGVDSRAAPGPGVARWQAPVRFSREELERGFSKTWQLQAGAFAPAGAACMGQDMQGELTLRWKTGPGDVELGLDACLHLAAGEQRSVTARGEPAGGRFDFSAAPGGLFTIAAPGGPGARVTAATPGRGEFTARYTVAGGRSASRSQPASVVALQRIEGITGADDIVELGLMDADGRPLTTPRAFALRTEPAGAGDLLVFRPTVEGIVGTAPGREALQVQPLKPGTTGLQPHTLCGTPLPGALTVKVVTCDATTREELQRRQRAAKERSDAIAREVTQLLNDDEFERVEREIEADTINMAVKLGETIVGALSLGQGSRLAAVQGRFGEKALRRGVVKGLADRQAAVELATKIYDAYDTTMDQMEGLQARADMMDGTLTAEQAYDGIAKGVLATVAHALDNDALGLGKSAGEAILAAQKMGRNLGTLAGVADRIAELDGRHDDARLQWERVSGLLRRCARGAGDDEPELLPPPPGERGRPQPGPRPSPPPQPAEPAPGPAPTPDPSPAPAPAPAPPPIEDPAPPPPARIGLPLCVTPDATPQAVAATLRRAADAHAALAARLQERAALAERPRTWLAALRATVARGPAAVRAEAPALRAHLGQWVLDLAAAGDAALDHLETSRRCAAELPLRSADLRRVEWKLGP